MRYWKKASVLPALLGAVLIAIGATGCGAGDDGDSSMAASNDGEEAMAMASAGQEGVEGGAGVEGESHAGEGDEHTPGGAQVETAAHAEGEHSGEGELAEVHLGPERARDLGIRVESVSAGSARSTVARPATLMLDPDRKAMVGPRLEAKVVRVVRDLGDRVQAGDTLAILTSVELGRAKSTFLTAQARFETAETTYHREESLYEKDISSEAEYLEARARFREARAELGAAREALRLYGLGREEIASIEAGGETPLARFALTSPVAGRVQERDLSPGQTVGPGDTPIHVTDVRRLWVMIEAYDRDVPLLEEGRPVELSVRSIPGRTFRGEIDWISYEMDPETRTLHVRALVDNEDGVLRAGMYGTARVHLASGVQRAMVPVDAVQTLHEHTVLFEPAAEDGAFRPVEVRLGQESEDGWVEVLSGVQPGDRVVFGGAFDLMSAATSGARSAAHSH